MNNKFLGICILISSLLISMSLFAVAYSAYLDRYSFYVDNGNHLFFTYDRHNGDVYIKSDTETVKKNYISNLK